MSASSLGLDEQLESLYSDLKMNMSLAERQEKELDPSWNLTQDDGEAQDDEDDCSSSSSSSSSAYEDELAVIDEQLMNAQRQWEESLEQLSKVLNLVVLPLFGKFIGRRTARIIWKRVMGHIW